MISVGGLLSQVPLAGLLATALIFSLLVACAGAIVFVARTTGSTSQEAAHALATVLRAIRRTRR